ncbi:4-hydroxy-3-methylbut-2-enyl diphosphate reductase [Buchnera aphidicola]|uniref:4-hydroxy-3-methylbut-2-enyl diphosphate reductase n=1 Tax=Buchnera aphidicola subsp. Melaphis rhois TaxID=118103 RepID=A0A4D6YAW1_BUCMH|nr:4-hydroxy-3-methylbut-2-enyl diphosphate reductase [Buchnera aphidicola]QCI23174.1 4-hydroxy-3-methylbut-2-enyl diphosphate reductase [Buchnera aphidicola (Melaphis rhois)]
MKIFLANPRGFCAGVKRAINIVNIALKAWGKPIYVNHEIVHNTYITNYLKSKGVIFNEKIRSIPLGSILIFSAHGVPKSLRNEAIKRKLRIIDATCPLVKKVHKEVSQASNLGFEAILIGTLKHPEVEGTLGQYDYDQGKIYLIESVKDVSKLKVNNPNKLMFMTQTTLSLEQIHPIIIALRKKYPNIISPKKPDICYATINRQIAVKEISKISDAIIIIGSKHSSNSNQLMKLGRKTGKYTALINSKNEIDTNYLSNNIQSIGVSAGASTPNIIIKQVIKRLSKIKKTTIQEISGIKENITFNLPKELKNIKFK